MKLEMDGHTRLQPSNFTHTCLGLHDALTYPVLTAGCGANNLIWLAHEEIWVAHEEVHVASRDFSGTMPRLADRNAIEPFAKVTERPEKRLQAFLRGY